MLTNYIVINNTKIYVTIHYNKRNPQHLPAVLFTVPTQINGILYDFHYHFGINEDDKTQVNPKLVEERKIIGPKKYTKNKRTKNKKSKIKKKIEILESDSLSDSSIMSAPYDFPNIIYFHKTIQVPSEDDTGHTKHTFCRFNNNIPIDNVMNIICLPENREIEVRTMETTFSPDELNYISTIISKPFLTNTTGKGRKTKRHKSK
jgi:hypothetical protein